MSTLNLNRLLFCLLVSAVVRQSNSFKHAKRKHSAPVLGTFGLKQFGRRSRHHDHQTRKQNCIQEYLQHDIDSAKHLRYSIRGGGVDQEWSDDSETTHSFIASFESELAQIRREISLEAETEMQKLRGLIERGDEEEDDEEDDLDSEYDDAVHRSKENISTESGLGFWDGIEEYRTEEENLVAEESAGVPTSQLAIDMQKIEREKEDVDEEDAEVAISSDVDHTEAGGGAVGALVGDDDEAIDYLDNSESESCEGLEANNSAGITYETDIGDNLGHEGEEEPILVKVDRDSHQTELGCSSKTNEIGHSDASRSELASTSSEDREDDFASTAAPELVNVGRDKTKTSKRSRPQMSKKKTKASKTRKATIGLSKERDLLDESHLDLEESAMLAHAQNEVTETPRSGILFYLRSDLGRSLILFIATIAVAIMLQRVQQQMEIEGNI